MYVIIGKQCGDKQSCINSKCVCASGTLCNGECTDLETDPTSCGHCGRQCPLGWLCRTWINASGIKNTDCYDAQNDTNACGVDAVKCPPGSVCFRIIPTALCASGCGLVSTKLTVGSFVLHSAVE